jgi:hypothetical protein
VRRLAALALVLTGCGPAEDPALPPGASPAADALIEGAASPEEREQLAAVRDEVDAQKRAEAEALDAEIERLERENAELRSGR